MLLPVRRLHHLFDASPLGLTQQCQQALLLGNALDFGSSLFGGALAVTAADMTLRRAVALDLTLLFLDAAVLRFRDFAMEGVDIIRLRWFAAPELTLARPKAPQSQGEPFNGRLWLGQPMPTPMRTMRRKSSRFCALKSARTSSGNLVGITTGAPSPRQ